MTDQTERSGHAGAPGASGPQIGGCKLGSVLGRGGMGTVYRATQIALAREVAVKVVPASGAADADVARFQREARIAARLEHPSCVPIYAAGEQDGLLYLVMKLIHGPNLGALVAREGPLTPERAVEILGQIADALDAAHAAGLVHRDVKPSNVLIELRRDAERAYLSDFGLMRQVIDDHEITGTNEWIGTIDYASPEQLSGRAIDRRADVYALAAVLYAALSGQRPFPRDSATATAWAHLNVPPPALGDHPLDRVIARGMAKRPEDRYATAGALAQAARSALHPVGEPTVALPAPPITAPRRERRRSAPAAAVLVVAALVVVGVALVIGLSSGSVPKARRTTARTEVAVDAFRFSIPSSWRVTETEHSMGSFLRTEAQDPSGSQVVIIDRDPGEAQPPSTWAKSVEQETSGTAGYAEVSFSPATISGRQAEVWKFRLDNDSPSAQVDVFQQLGSNGFAVLGQAATSSAATRIALAVAASLSPR
jgi:serine/threonine protein kinase